MFWMLLSGCLSVEAYVWRDDEQQLSSSTEFLLLFLSFFFSFSFLLEPAISSGVWDDSLINAVDVCGRI